MVRMRVAGRRAEGGFTLVELMIVVMIAGILVAIAVPGMRTLTAVFKIVGTDSITRPEPVLAWPCSPG